MRTPAPSTRRPRHRVRGRTWAGRLAAALFVLAGVVVLALVAVIPESDGAGLEPVAGIIAIAFGVAAFFAPWHRWSERALLVCPVVGLGLLTFAIALGGGALDYYVAVYPVPFVYAGLTQRPGTVVALTPVALASILAAGFFGGWSATAVTNLAIALPMSVVIGELLAVANRRQQRAEVSMAALLEGVRSLNHANAQDEAADVVATLGASIGAADLCVVVLMGRRGTDRQVVRTARCRPGVGMHIGLERAVQELGRSVVDPGAEPVMIPDLAGPTAPADRLAGLGLRSALLVPIVGGAGPLGFLAVMWRGRRASLSASMESQLELLTEEAGRSVARIRATARLAREAETDALTGLANRRSYARALDRIEPGDAVAIVDLDHFKEVNDRKGHDAGDAVLRVMAECLREVARAGDCVARYGGEEFALVLAGADVQGARAAMARVRQRWEERSGPTTFSAGIAVADADESPAETLRRADVALYAAKRGGRDRVAFASAPAVAS